jgi:hypothetical protein
MLCSHPRVAAAAAAAAESGQLELLMHQLVRAVEPLGGPLLPNAAEALHQIDRQVGLLSGWKKAYLAAAAAVAAAAAAAAVAVSAALCAPLLCRFLNLNSHRLPLLVRHMRSGVFCLLDPDALCRAATWQAYEHCLLHGAGQQQQQQQHQ